MDDQLKTKDKVFVLFYASWCPFSQRFLPIFKEYEQNNPQACLRIMIDGKPSLCEKYSVEYYPTVILFEKGKVKERIDAIPGIGLTKRQLTELTNTT